MEESVFSRLNAQLWKDDLPTNFDEPHSQHQRHTLRSKTIFSK